MKKLLVVVPVVLVALMTGCCRDKSSPAPSKGSNTSSSTDWQGDASKCAAVRACCTAKELALFCALSKANSKGDCAMALPPIRSYVKEAKVTPPAGCL